MSAEPLDSAPNIPNFSLSDVVVRQSDLVIKKLKRSYPNVDLSRFEAYRTSINTSQKEKEHGLQKPFMGYYPDLTAQPFWEPADSELTMTVARELQLAAPAIREEYVRVTSVQSVVRRYGAAGRYSTLAGDDWGGAILYENGKFTKIKKVFPQTCETIAKLRDYIVGEAVFLVLKPRVVLPAHTDATNAQLTCHLGLVVPDDCGIEVGSETRTWSEGGVLFFDHSYVHRAWNDGAGPRVVLLLNIRHPEISEEEHRVHLRFLKELRYRVVLQQPALFARRVLKKVGLAH